MPDLEKIKSVKVRPFGGLRSDLGVESFPETPGVYTMRGGKGEILYIGKAGNLRRRVSSYFLKIRDAGTPNVWEVGLPAGSPTSGRIEKLMQEVKEITYEETDTALEALILESKLIKEKHPVYNIREQDDKSFLYVAITREEFPRVLLARGKDFNAGRFNLLREVKPPKGGIFKTFGPFTSGASIREAMRILRRIFPWSVHPQTDLRFKNYDLRTTHKSKIVNHKSACACFDYEVGLCPGTCIGVIDKDEYRKNIRRLVDVFEGKKKRVLLRLEREMTKASKDLEFERAAKLRKQIFALQHIQDVALLNEDAPRFNLMDSKVKPLMRIEGYDISNISGTSAVGVMVVFKGDEPDKNEYRKFKIRTIAQSDDVGMIKEVLRRRFNNAWPLPNLMLIDGGRGQVNAAREVLKEVGRQIPIVGIAKGPTRKKNEFIGKIPPDTDVATLIKVRDEAHRFAIAYHKKLRGKNFLG